MTDTALEGDYGTLCKVISVHGEAYGQLVPEGMDFHDQALDNCSYPSFPLHPFIGIMGVAPDTDAHLCSIPPYDFGGNIDVNDMTEGSVLFLPIQVEGAKFFVGDPHYAQGDGEVSLTALEAPLRATLTFPSFRNSKRMRCLANGRDHLATRMADSWPLACMRISTRRYAVASITPSACFRHYSISPQRSFTCICLRQLTLTSLKLSI